MLSTTRVVSTLVVAGGALAVLTGGIPRDPVRVLMAAAVIEGGKMAVDFVEPYVAPYFSS